MMQSTDSAPASPSTPPTASSLLLPPSTDPNRPSVPPPRPPPGPPPSLAPPTPPLLPQCLRPPIGLSLLIFAASLAVRAALLAGLGKTYMLLCGAPQDWSSALAFTLLATPLPPLRPLLTTLALAHILLDFGLQLTGGARLHAATWLFIGRQATSLSSWRTLMKNGAMVPPAAWAALGALLPAAAAARHEPRWRPSLSPRAWLAGLAGSALALWSDPPCCRGEACAAEAEVAQQPNALRLLALAAPFLRAAGGGGGGAERSPAPSDELAVPLLGRPAARTDGGRPRARAAAASRNVVLLTLESVGALHLGLYNAEQKVDTMPFLSWLHRYGKVSLVERMYATEPNTLHSFYASHCGVRPYLGVRRAEWEHQRYHNSCLPALLRKHRVHSALFSTSQLSLQPELGFDSVWSSMLRAPKERKMYNFLGHDDFVGLPAIERFIRTMGERRFMLSALTMNTHSPFQPGHDKRWGCPLDRNISRWAANREGKRVSAGQRAPLAEDLSRRPSQQSAFSMSRCYVRGLRCADMYIERLFRILDKAGRLHDTTLLITADHGEGFMQVHREDVGHGGAIYNTQSQIPFVLIGPAAVGLPKRLGGVWSDTSIMHTALDVLGLPPHPLIDEHAAEEAKVARGSDDLSGPLRKYSELMVTPSDLLGLSVLSHWQRPPARTFTSCAFEDACMGLCETYTKWVLRMDSGQLHAYFHDDHFETQNIALRYRQSHKAAVRKSLKAWKAAVDSLHNFVKVERVSECPYHAPYRMRGTFTYFTHCCSHAPTTRRDLFRRHYDKCENATIAECPSLDVAQSGPSENKMAPTELADGA
ncbi:hypothetical protein AB1Y20_004686 [Prymnesium parvum]|uniref:Sulfatase N-terminal domain-containing protein n=1 Tax=Prymnesium parvum TaxID=97485 RepID=A0AB34IZ27_PRYPA